ncbi:hypothetical protein GWI33_015241 [Rhynchophorus ferrugineus]|uniref:endo-polygalacturonase n=1 Tax=Rhynchophorus ferrugineus TaxID=354439 RepID=A0A834I5F4_RHYFE|nr:hypothetical protein GWI33_015241 [Rhynchophorus ferrugineus]
MKFIIFWFICAVLTLSSAEDCVVNEFSRVQEALDKCDDIVFDNLSVPGGETLKLLPRDGTTIRFEGRTVFGYAEWAGPLVAINGTNITIEGGEGSVLDGQGQLYWDGQGEWGTLKPKFFIIQLHDSIFKNIYVLNSPVHCVLLTDSTGVTFSNWTIDNSSGDEDKAPDNFGHNTDGFDVFNSTDIILEHASVFNQDDCVAVRSGSNILIDDFYCHGGHGLSISVGFSNDSFALNTLFNVTFSNSHLEGGENGIHIKTHIDSSKGLMQNITYRNVTFNGPSKYGINVQQNYKNMPANSSFPAEPDNNIPIRNLQLIDVGGNVKESAIPIYILCAKEGCFDWSFRSVYVNGKQSNDCNYSPVDFTC